MNESDKSRESLAHTPSIAGAVDGSTKVVSLRDVRIAKAREALLEQLLFSGLLRFKNHGRDS